MKVAEVRQLGTLEASELRKSEWSPPGGAPVLKTRSACPGHRAHFVDSVMTTRQAAAYVAEGWG